MWRSPNDITYWVAQLCLGYKYSSTHYIVGKYSKGSKILQWFKRKYSKGSSEKIKVFITPWYSRYPGMVHTTLECRFGLLRYKFSFIDVLRRLWQRLSMPENLYSCRPSNKPIYVFGALSFAFSKLESETIGNSVMFMIRICHICIFVFVF